MPMYIIESGFIPFVASYLNPCYKVLYQWHSLDLELDHFSSGSRSSSATVLNFRREKIIVLVLFRDRYHAIGIIQRLASKNLR